jgi:PAS domain S-box-containing protein
VKKTVVEVLLRNNQVVVLRPRFAVGAIATCFLLSAMTFVSWTLGIPILRTLIPGLPGMIPTTALVISLIGVALLLAFPSDQNQATQDRRTFISFILSLLTIVISLTTLADRTFGLDLEINVNAIFMNVQNPPRSLPGSNLSVQIAFSALFLAVALFNHLILRRIQGRIAKATAERMIFLIQLLPTLTLGVCVLAAIGYLQAIGGHVPGTKFLGLSMPTMISFSLLAIGTYQLRRTEGLVGIVLQDSSAGLFMRRFTLFSILGPIIITGFISWGQSEGLYPDSFSLSLFVIFTMGSLLATSFLTAGAISETEEQRIATETNKSREALQEKEETLRQTRDRLQFALDASDMGTWEIDLTGTNRFRWSSTTERLFGLPSGTFTGDADELNARIHPEDSELFASAQISAISDHQDLDVEFRCLKADGTVSWLRAKGRATYDSNGEAIKISGTVLDVSRERLQQRATEEALKSAQSANDLKSNFLASMSHEIRTPLGAILGFTELLRDPELEARDRNEYLQVITRNGETLSQLINDILDLSKVEAGHMNIETIRFPLATVTEEVTTIMRSKADQRGIELTVRFAPDLPAFITSDPVRIKQILFNLVGNAIKFTPSGEVEVMVRRDGENIFFDVRDTGIGISDAQRSLLFQPFIQADGSITRRFGGTGLGLSLSRNLANLLGGEVELLQSAEGQGSTFRASIKNRVVAKKEDVSSHDFDSDLEELMPKEVSLAGVEILVVDDSVDNQNLIEHILRKRGAKLEFADDGLEATRMAAATKFDVILMDLQMPVMDGFAATEAVRKQGFRGPIIALTAHAMKDTHADCLRVGCTGFLSKPIDSQNLVKTIHRLLQEA